MGQRYHEIQKLVIQEVAHHRNGVSGVPFYVIKFRDVTPGEPHHEMVGVLFDRDEYEEDVKKNCFANPYCAVLDTDLLTKGVVTFAINSFRGDHYVDKLCDATKKWERSEKRRWKKELKQMEMEKTRKEKEAPSNP